MASITVICHLSAVAALIDAAPRLKLAAPRVEIPPPAHPPSPVARIVVSELSTCLDECVLQADIDSVLPRYQRFQNWLQSRELLVRWAAERWLLKQLPPTIIPYSMLLPPAEPSITLGSALAPAVSVKRVASTAFKVMPLRAVRLCWACISLWVAVKVLPTNGASSHRRRSRLDGIMLNLAELHEEAPLAFFDHPKM